MYCMSFISDYIGTKKGKGGIKRPRRFWPGTKASDGNQKISEVGRTSDKEMPLLLGK